MLDAIPLVQSPVTPASACLLPTQKATCVPSLPHPLRTLPGGTISPKRFPTGEYGVDNALVVARPHSFLPTYALMTVPSGTSSMGLPAGLGGPPSWFKTVPAKPSKGGVSSSWNGLNGGSANSAYRARSQNCAQGIEVRAACPGAAH